MLHLFTLAASQWYTMYYEIVINITSGDGTIFQQGGQDPPFAAGGLGGAVMPQRASGAEPRRQADFDNNLLKIN